MSFEMDRNLETRLRQARPASPDQPVAGRIEAALRKNERNRHITRIRNWIAWGGLAAAASVLIGFGVLLFNGRLNLSVDRSAPAVGTESAGTEPSAAKQDGYEPMVAENNLKSRIDEGIVFLRNGLTARRYRYEFIDRVVWKNPHDGSVIEMEIPRDEVVLIPVQTF